MEKYVIGAALGIGAGILSGYLYRRYKFQSAVEGFQEVAEAGGEAGSAALKALGGLAGAVGGFGATIGEMFTT